MPTVRQRVRVLAGGRVEITDPSLQEGAEVEVSVSVPEPSGDGAPPDPVPADPAPPMPEAGASPAEVAAWIAALDALPPLPFDQVVGAAPSGRTADEVDRDLRALRDEWDEPFARREQGEP